MRDLNGSGVIYLEGFSLQRNTDFGVPSAIIVPRKSASALREFVARLRNTGIKLEDRLTGQIWLYGDGRARIEIPNDSTGQNGSNKINYINLDPHETRVLAMTLQNIGINRLEVHASFQYGLEARRRLEEFLELYQ